VSSRERRNHLIKLSQRAQLILPKTGWERHPGAMRMVNTSEQKSVNIGDLVQWARDSVDQFETPRRIRALQMHDQQEWAFVEGSKTGMPVSELTVVTSASAVMEEAPADPVASPLMNETRKPSSASLSAQHAARTSDLPTGAGPGRQKRHFTASIRVPPEQHTSRTSSLVVVLTFALGAIASAAGIYALDWMNRSPRPSPIETETRSLLPSPMPTPPSPIETEAPSLLPSPMSTPSSPIKAETPSLFPSPMPAPPPAPVIVKTAPVVPNASGPAMERPVQFELNTSEIWEVQTRLEWLGMQPGSPDGIPGYRTFNAVRRYEESRGQAQTGNVDRKLLEQLRGEPK
jgi:hypothetical protein